MSFDPYAELGVARGASDAEIKAAFRLSAKRAHPDNGGSAEAFVRVGRAAAVLRDPARRRRYDEAGDVGESPTADDEQSKALALIATAFEQALAQPDGAILAVMRAQIDRARASVRQKQAEFAARVARYERLRGRFVAAKGTPNHIQSMIEAQIVTLRRSEAQIAADLRIADEAIEILAGYRYDGPAEGMVGIGAFMVPGQGPFARFG